MATADELRAQLAVAELEEKLAAAKESDGDVDRELKEELRYARWIARGGPALPEEDDNRATAAFRERYKASKTEA